MFDLATMSATKLKIVYAILILYFFVIFVRSAVSLKDETDKETKNNNNIAYDAIMILVSLVYAVIFIGVLLHK